MKRIFSLCLAVLLVSSVAAAGKPTVKPMSDEPCAGCRTVWSATLLN